MASTDRYCPGVAVAASAGFSAVDVGLGGVSFASGEDSGMTASGLLAAGAMMGLLPSGTAAAGALEGKGLPAVNLGGNGL